MTQDLKTKLYIVRGNHDTRGPGGSVYLEVMREYLENVTGMKLPENAQEYAFMHEKDLFIGFDCMAPDTAFVKKVLTEHPDARHVFFLTHFPLVPCTTGGLDWIIFGCPHQPEKRRELLKLLAARNAIVLCAHTHRPALFEYSFPEGKIIQFTSFSLPPRIEQTFSEKPADDPFRKAMKTAHFKTMRADYEPAFTRGIFYTPDGNFNVLSVNGDSVTMQIYSADGSEMLNEVKLR